MQPDPFRPSDAETPEEETARIKRGELWQAVMRTEEGRKVLARILNELGLFSPVSGERMAGRHEAAILLSREMASANDKLFRAVMQEAFDDDAF